MKFIYICGAVPETVNDALKQSVAGNKFSLNMGKAIDKILNGELIYLTTGRMDEEKFKLCSNEIWNGKKLDLLKRGKHFVIQDLVLRKNVKKRLKEIRAAFPEEEIAVIVENAPFAVSTACKQLKKKLKFSCYSCILDTPFVAFSHNGIKGRINNYMFTSGIRALQSFDGIISFTEEVMKELKIDSPFCPLAIGYDTQSNPEYRLPITEDKTAVFAGTLIYYNGIRELLDAYTFLGSEYKLHIYGYGPMEEEVKRAAEKQDNIIFHGRFNPSQTEQILSNYQLLINPRRIDPAIENFTFPSKLIDYIMTGKNVLTSNFKTLPEQYKEFVYVLEDLNAQSIANSVRKVFAEELSLRKQRGKRGIQYVKDFQTYDKIAQRIVNFVRE